MKTIRLSDWLRVLALTAFATAPLYDVLGRQAQFWTAHQAGSVDLLLFVAVVSVALPLFACGVVWILAQLAGRWAFDFATIALAACVAIPWIARGVEPGWLALVSAGAIAVALLATVHRFDALRLLLAVLGPPAAIAFPAVFLSHSAVSVLLEGETIPDAPRLETDVPVVVIVFDALPTSSILGPDLRVDAGSFPSFGRLAARSTWYRNATTVALSTEFAVPALLTGRRPEPGDQPTYVDHPASLFSWLSSSGPVLAAESTTRLCPPLVCDRERPPLAGRMKMLLFDAGVVFLHILLPEDLRGGLPRIGGQWRDFALAPDVSASRVAAVERFADQIESLADPGLIYLHVYLPHGPFWLLPSGARYVPDAGGRHAVGLAGSGSVDLGLRLGTLSSGTGGFDVWARDDALIALGVQRHLLHVHLADRLLGRVLDVLERAGLFDRSLVVVTSDHGESFVAGEPVRTTQDGNTLHVPLFVKRPGQQAGAVDDRRAQLVDVLPTIASALGQPLPWEVDGRDLLTPWTEPRTAVRVFDGAEAHARPASMDTLAAALRRTNALVGAGRSLDGVYRVGPHPELVGRTVEEVGRGRLERVTVGIQQREQLDHFDPDSGFVPAYLTGRVGGDRVPDALAFAIDGVIRATAKPYPGEDGQVGFAVLVPESAFREGANPVEVYEVIGTP